MQRRLFLCAREGPGGLRPTLLTEREAQLARWAQAVRVVGSERRSLLVEVEGGEQVAAEVAVVARHLLRCSPTLRHVPARPPHSIRDDGTRRHSTTPDPALQRRIPQMPCFFSEGSEKAGNGASSPPSRREEPARCGEIPTGPASLRPRG